VIRQPEVAHFYDRIRDTTTIALQLAYFGFTALHRARTRTAFRDPSITAASSSHLWRVVGWVSLGAAMWPSVLHWGWSIGAAMWGRHALGGRVAAGVRAAYLREGALVTAACWLPAAAVGFVLVRGGVLSEMPALSLSILAITLGHVAVRRLRPAC